MAQPFFNTNYRVASTAPAANLIAQAGAVQGQMFANLGKTIGNTLEKYRDNKEKKERQEMSENMFLRQYESNPDNPLFKNLGIQNSEEAKEVAKAVSKDPSLVNDAIRLGQIATQAQDRELKNSLIRDQQNRLMQKEQSDRNIAKFNFARPEMPITEDTPGEKMPELDPDPFAPPPSTAVTMLPERFQGQGRQVQDAVESGQLSPLEGNRIIGSIYSQAMAEQKTGLTPSEELAREKFEYEKGKDQKLEDEKNKPKPPVYQERTLLAIDDALKILNDDSFRLPVAGLFATTASEIGGTDAANLRQAISTIESSIGFDRLQKMRDDSPTGGALGQVSERELSLLNASLGSLSQMQSVEQLRTNLERVRTHYDNFIKSINARNQGLSADNLDSGYKMLNMGSPAIDEADLDRQIQEKQKQLQMRNTLNNPNMPNYGNQFR
ncbi:MAG: hypothetical protein VW879_04860 [Opitutae bacterium]